ncbi:YjfB family protein [Poriferisphaera sp. WC338]|uniref:YjfB family protein n=1 Tax=Poriferisphaera sp. WC338 TaxID=3425129 RepID=UPI003D818C9C
MTNGIAALASATTHAQLMNQVNTAVAKKTLDNAKAQGDAMVSLLQDSVQMQQDAIRANPHLGNMIDVSA